MPAIEVARAGVVIPVVAFLVNWLAKGELSISAGVRRVHLLHHTGFYGSPLVGPLPAL